MKILLIILLPFIAFSSYAQLKNGNHIPDIQFATILNSPVKSAKLSQLKGKVVIIDFWATWCGSCLEAMPHLMSLQHKYQGSLHIIAVTEETQKRTALYLKSRPSNLWFAADTSGNIAKLFPHQLIPHTILIDTEGNLVAATSPEMITDKIMDSLLANQKVHLPEKVDNMISNEELLRKSFAAADTTSYRFMMQGEIKGGAGMSTTWLDNTAFSERRLTCINLPLISLYRIANGNIPYSRTINNLKDEKDTPVYCLDIIVKTPEELLSALQKELSKRFDIQAKRTLMDKEIQVLRITDLKKFKDIPRNTSGKRTYYSRHGEIDQQSITMPAFAQYLENYGTGKLVSDETGNGEKLDIKFTFQPENLQSLLDTLKDMGLGLFKEHRQIELLTLYKQDQ